MQAQTLPQRQHCQDAHAAGCACARGSTCHGRWPSQGRPALPRLVSLESTCVRPEGRGRAQSLPSKLSFLTSSRVPLLHSLNTPATLSPASKRPFPLPAQFLVSLASSLPPLSAGGRTPPTPSSAWPPAPSLSPLSTSPTLPLPVPPPPHHRPQHSDCRLRPMQHATQWPRGRAQGGWLVALPGQQEHTAALPLGLPHRPVHVPPCCSRDITLPRHQRTAPHQPQPMDCSAGADGRELLRRGRRHGLWEPARGMEDGRRATGVRWMRRWMLAHRL